MPRRGNEVVQLPMPPRKKTKTIELPPAPSTISLDVSFSDDEALTPGIIFTDIQQKKWRIGKPIGRGSFGRIYLASNEVDKDVTKLSARYVIKIEPHTNGPLFVEVHCMIRTAQASNVKEWRLQHNQKRLGMPIYIANGSFTDETSGSKYRFLVLPRYDIDLHKIIARSRTRVLDVKNVLVLAIQILDVLEYLHSEGYTHSDIKSSNLMLGYDGSKIGKVPIVRLTPSLQKEMKEAILSTKHRKVKQVKSRSSNYYIDEDFVAKDYKSPNNSDDDGEKRLATVKKKLCKILTDKDRMLHRHHAFNLRQLTRYVNYEDLNSSVCSDQSYQKLIDDFGNKNLIQTTKQFQESKAKRDKQLIQTKYQVGKDKSDTDHIEIYKEAVLSQSNSQIYLLDYGLASKFLDTEGEHKEFAEDARKAHDGTLEYSSRDSHVGAHSRRSDFETLGYNLLDWLTGTLPWKTAEVLAEPDLVHAIKKNYMSDLKLLLRTCFKTEFYPHFMEKYLEYVTSLDFSDKPDYDYCRSLFKSELLKSGSKGELNFVESPMSPINRNKLWYSKRFGRKNTPPNFLAINGIKKSIERENVCSLENDLKLELLRQTLNISSEGFRKPCASRNFFISDADLVARLKKSLMPHGVFGKKLSPKNLRSKQNLKKRKSVRRHRNSIGKFGNFMGSARQFTWAEILAGNPEHIIRKERNPTTDVDEDFDDDNCKYRIRTLSNASEASDSNGRSPLLQEDYLQDKNPTDAMKDVFAIIQNNVSDEVKDNSGIPEGYTPAMVKVLRAKQDREAKEKLEALKSPPKNELKRCSGSKKVIEPSSRVTRQKIRIESAKDVVTPKKNTSKSTEPIRTDSAKDVVIPKKNTSKSIEPVRTDNAKDVVTPKKNSSKSIEPVRANSAKDVVTPKKNTSKSIEPVRADSAKDVVTPKKNTSKSIEPSARVTRQKARIIRAKSEVVIKSNVRTKSKSKRKPSKRIQIIDEKPQPPTKIVKRSPSKKPEVIITHRMRLRSARANK